METWDLVLSLKSIKNVIHGYLYCGSQECRLFLSCLETQVN